MPPKPTPGKEYSPIALERIKNLGKVAHSSHWRVDAEFQLLQHFCRADFWTFFQLAFGAGRNPKGDKWIDPFVHIPLAKWFQAHVDDWFAKRDRGEGEKKRLAVIVHRGVGKTTMITQAGQAWLHLRDPEMSSYTGTERTELSMKCLESIKAVFDGSDPYAMFTQFYGNWATAARRWTGKDIVHSARRNVSRRDPSLGTFAVETSIVGAHPDVIFYDDPISYERLQTDSNWISTVNNQLVSLIPVLQSDGLLIMSGTRYEDNDQFGTLIAEEGVATITGMESDSVTLDPAGIWHVYFLAGRDKDGKPTTPRVWPEIELQRYQRSHQLKFAAQIMNDPQSSEHNPVTKDQLNQCWMESEQVPWSALRYALLCDTAFFDGQKLQRKDETVMVVVGYPRNGSGDIYACECHNSNVWRGEDLAKRLVSKVQQYRRQGRKVFAIGDEKLSGKRGSWKMVLQNYFADANEPMPTYYEFDRQTQSGQPTAKTDRLVAMANTIVDGHVKFVKGGPGLDGLVEQISRIGQYMVNRRLKIDRADAFSDAIRPELYSPMRRVVKSAAPWEREQFIDDDNPRRRYEDDDERDWNALNPRPPLRG